MVIVAGAELGKLWLHTILCYWAGAAAVSCPAGSQAGAAEASQGSGSFTLCHGSGLGRGSWGLLGIKPYCLMARVGLLRLHLTLYCWDGQLGISVVAAHVCHAAGPKWDSRSGHSTPHCVARLGWGGWTSTGMGQLATTNSLWQTHCGQLAHGQLTAAN